MEREAAKLSIRVQPNARESRISGFKEGVLQVRIAAPAVDGKANEALIKYLSKLLDVSKSSITIERGLTGRNKILSISGLSLEELSRKLSELAG